MAMQTCVQGLMLACLLPGQDMQIPPSMRNWVPPIQSLTTSARTDIIPERWIGGSHCISVACHRQPRSSPSFSWHVRLHALPARVRHVLSCFWHVSWGGVVVGGRSWILVKVVVYELMGHTILQGHYLVPTSSGKFFFLRCDFDGHQPL